jgi:hypothetical protein
MDMSARLKLSLSLWCISFSILSPTIGKAQESRLKPPAKRDLPIVFAVWPAKTGPDYSHSPDFPLIDPIAVIDAGKFRNVTGFDSNDEKERDAAYVRFEAKYYRAGFRYSLFFHGAVAGSAATRKPVGISCMSSTATVALSTPLSRGELGLAVSEWESPALHADRDLPATPAEKMRFRDASIQYLAGKGVAKVHASGIEVTGVRSVFLGRDLPNVLVGSAFLKQKTAMHELFLTLNDDGQKTKIALASYHLAKDVDDGTDSKTETFVSHLDLDGDGLDEIVTTSYYYESWDYAIYKFQDGAWKAVYSGSGGGC